MAVNTARIEMGTEGCCMWRPRGRENFMLWNLCNWGSWCPAELGSHAGQPLCWENYPPQNQLPSSQGAKQSVLYINYTLGSCPESPSEVFPISFFSVLCLLSGLPLYLPELWFHPDATLCGQAWDTVCLFGLRLLHLGLSHGGSNILLSNCGSLRSSEWGI